MMPEKRILKGREVSMTRNVRRMAQKRHDVLVIGGGVTGAFIAWDCSLRGLSVALVDKGDFGAATSAATSKLIHGGLRYLKTLEVGLVRESLQERRIMEIIAPHLVYPLPFVFPAYGRGMRGMPAVLSAMVFYDSLSYDRRWINDDDKKIPGHAKFTAEEILSMEPVLDPEDLTGGVVYYDCQMYSPERLTLEPILSACEFGAEAANYTKAEEIIVEGDRVCGARVRDLLDQGRPYEIRSAVTVNAAGPWADTIMAGVRGATRHGLVRSKGIHILTRPIQKDRAIVLQTKSGRHFFIIPWRGHSLIGTTDVVYRGDPDDCRVTAGDIREFLSEINATVPSARLEPSDVLFQYCGLRPIVEKDTSVQVEVYDASRKYELYDHEEHEGVKGFVSAIGGKYTTSRNMARQVVDMIVRKIRGTDIPCETHTTPLYGGEIGRFTSFVERAKKRNADGIADEVVVHLCRNYGSRYQDVLASGRARNRTSRICAAHPDIWAQIAYAVDVEMASRLTDVLFRRTGLCTLGNPGEDTIERVGAFMAGELGWTRSSLNAEIDAAMAVFGIRQDDPA